MKKFKKNHAGHYAMVRWDCVGIQEGILTYIDDDKLSARWFSLSNDVSSIISVDQVVSIGDHVLPSPSKK